MLKTSVVKKKNMSEHINVMLKVTEKEVSLITSPLSFSCTSRTYHKHILFLVCYNNWVTEPHVFISSLVCLLHSYNCLVTNSFSENWLSFKTFPSHFFTSVRTSSVHSSSLSKGCALQANTWTAYTDTKKERDLLSSLFYESSKYCRILDYRLRRTNH